MIKYALACERAHKFESWFPSSAAYESQQSRGLVTCPLCDSSRIEKQVMAPAIGRSDKPTVVQQAAPQPVVALSDAEREIRAMLRALREHVVQNAEDVGTGFVEEARKMHYGETDRRSIYGRADLEEARALVDEGIEVMPLPIVPDDRN